MSASTIHQPDPATALSSKVTTTKKARRPSPLRHRWLPYLLLLPAVVMELLIHIVPMLVGIWMLRTGFTGRSSSYSFSGGIRRPSA